MLLPKPTNIWFPLRPLKIDIVIVFLIRPKDRIPAVCLKVLKFDSVREGKAKSLLGVFVR